MKIKPPRYIHDCEDCIYLGRFRRFDLYGCGTSERYSLIARFGNEGSEYESYPNGWRDVVLPSSRTIPQLEAAQRRWAASNTN